MEKREIAVVGGGLAGKAMAIALAQSGFDTVLIAPSGKSDTRTTALIGSSMAFLERIGLEANVSAKAEPLAVMRLIDDTGRLLRAPSIEFRATEIDLPAFGYNIKNRDLAEILDEAAGKEGNLERRDASATAFETDRDGAVVRLSDGEEIGVSLVIAADGRKSAMREAAGIKTRTWRYPQTALVLNISHAVSHNSVSTEFHTRTGPFTQVPMPGRNSAIVWVEKPDLAELYVDLKHEKLERIIEDKMHSILGKVTIESEISAFPLSSATVERLTDERLALIGEAAHVFPPIGAQGLNLGLRDCSVLLDCLEESRDDPGRRSTLLRFEAKRRGDVSSRTAGVDALNRSLLTDFLPIQLGRSVGLTAMAASSQLRRFAMREGVSPGAGFFGLPKTLSEWARRKQSFGNEI
ncbi:2-octaprenyl-6-methoxyphenyl hydroxylase [Fulvimarina pelagi HTCC2506]|uniref:2-octaprenyl-6-methoxyphenyl hydroxylase n=1 Tax=Fulvimarina pelagi HTCC2506 TaxID=314231 RepID=Q0G6S5_9HYPH|nr:UbiH/UbiF family hydroxylase [Fulvimarina pelagi]EAU42639.1 2-octaprenyl-6-methoxyphenyl hydroxylase [Fulvimarina pelagi HTCC2506]